MSFIVIGSGVYNRVHIVCVNIQMSPDCRKITIKVHTIRGEADVIMTHNTGTFLTAPDMLPCKLHEQLNDVKIPRVWFE